MIVYYFTDETEAAACAAFDELTRNFPQIHFYQPSPRRDPWHWHAKLDTGTDEPIVLNFWPHKEKAQRQPGTAVTGPNAARDVILDAITDQASARAALTATIE